MKFIKKAWFSFLVLLSFSALSQDFYFDSYGHESGISQATGLGFSQDKQGFIWVFTHDGINRFDGRNFKSFNHISDNPNSLLDNSILDILSDKEGYTWILTSIGLCRYSPYLGDFEPFLHIDKSYLEGYKLYEANDGEIWVFNNDGLILINNDRMSAIHFDGDIVVNDVIDISNRIVWLSTNDGLYQYDKGYNSLEYLHLKGITINKVIKVGSTFWLATGDGLYTINDGKLLRSHHLQGEIIQTIIADRDDNLWIATIDLFFLDQKLDELININYDFKTTASLQDMDIMSLFKDSNNGIWIGTDGFGIKHYNPNKLNFESMKFSNKEKSLASPFVTSIYEGDDYTWIGTMKGLTRLSRSGNIKNYYTSDGLSNKQIYSIDQWNNRLLIGTKSSLDILNSNNTFDSFRNIIGSSVRCMLPEPDTLWIGTTEGVYYTTVKSNGYFNYLEIKDRTETLYRSADDHLWVGTINGVYEISNGKIINYFNQNNGLANNSVKCIVEDNHDQIWIGTKGGLSLYNPTSHDFTNYYKKDGLPNNVIYGIIPDSKENLWLSTNAGLCQFQPDSKNYLVFDEQDNLQGYEFNTGASHKGASGLFYFGGVNGLSYFNPLGISTNTSPPSTLVTEIKLDRKKLDVSIQGVLKKHPSVVDTLELKYFQNNLIFEFTGLSFEDPQKMKYRYQLVNLNDSWVETLLPFAEFTNLDPGDYEFIVSSSTRFSDWSEPSKPIIIKINPPIWDLWWVKLSAISILFFLLFVIYKYKINAYKRQQKILEKLVWERTDEITAQNEELQAQSESIEIQNQELSEQKGELHALNSQLEIMVENRTIELTDANKKLLIALDELDLFVYRSSHDLRGPLASLLGLILLAKMELNDKSAINLMGKIENTVNHLDQTLAKLLTINVVNKGADIKKSVIVKEVLLGVVDEFPYKIDQQRPVINNNIASHLVIDTDSGLLKIIFEQLLANSLTFNCCNPAIIDVSCTQKLENLEIRFSDNGIGIKDDIRTHIFAMFFRGSEKSTGNGLGLYIVQKIVEKMNGKIDLNSEESGTTFIITLPKQMY